VPVDQARRNLVIKAYPFRVDILHLDRVLASHPRCYGREEDIFDPLHYLPLLEQRPGAFAHAKPLRQWRKEWPHVYERLLSDLQGQWPEGRGIREFIRILQLHRKHPDRLVKQAIEQALEYGCPHGDGVELCLRQLQSPETPKPAALDPARYATEGARWAVMEPQEIDLHRYDTLLERN